MLNKKYYFFWLFISLILLNSCNKKPKTNKPLFLIGSWERVNDKKGNSTFENWNTDFSGIGYTLKNMDTLFKEELSIISKNDTLYLQVIGVNKVPTLFKFTKQTDTSFISENPTNEFPKVIRYFLDKQLLKAEVSNDDFKLDFIFKRILN